MAAFKSTKKGGEQESLTFGFIDELVASTLGRVQGEDTNGKEYKSIKEMWDFELNLRNEQANKNWYKDGLDYWEDAEKCDISDDGVLQGYGKLTPADTVGSNLFLDAVLRIRPEMKLDVAADGGAGIGRVTKHFLMTRFNKVHLIEVSPRLLASAPEYIGEEHKDRMQFIVQGLQDFAPKVNTYDCVWTQWVIGHLHDIDFVNFLRRCAAGLRPGGVIVLKDNCTDTTTFLVDKDDSSICRHIEYIRVLVRLAGLNIVHEQRQKGFPEELFPVVMMALSVD
jgi:protein N-terminal methyltransferase